MLLTSHAAHAEVSALVEAHGICQALLCLVRERHARCWLPVIDRGYLLVEACVLLLDHVASRWRRHGSRPFAEAAWAIRQLGHCSAGGCLVDIVLGLGVEAVRRRRTLDLLLSQEVGHLLRGEATILGVVHVLALSTSESALLLTVYECLDSLFIVIK